MLRVYNNTARYVDQGGNKVPLQGSRGEPQGMGGLPRGKGCPMKSRELMEWLWVAQGHKRAFFPLGWCLVLPPSSQLVWGVVGTQEVSLQGQFVLIWVVFPVPETWGFCHLPGAVAPGHL